jgi:hypothetical protein
MILAMLRTAMVIALVAEGMPAGAQATGAAPPSMTVRPGPPRPVRVSMCDAAGSYGAAYAGFSAGYYPFGPFFWNDPWGFAYQQYPLAPASGTLSIDYMNVTPSVMRTIDFGLIARGELVAEVRDVGTFSPNAEIKHRFGLSPNVFPLQTALTQCLPLRIIFADGTTWVNPLTRRLRREIYGE